jgi:hypothetical protein
MTIISKLTKIQVSSLKRTAEHFPTDATVRGFEDGFRVKNVGRSEEVVVLNDNLRVLDTAETNRGRPVVRPRPMEHPPRDALEATDPRASLGCGGLLLASFNAGQGRLLGTLAVGRAAGRGRWFQSFLGAVSSILDLRSRNHSVVITKNNAK